MKDKGPGAHGENGVASSRLFRDKLDEHLVVDFLSCALPSRHGQVVELQVIGERNMRVD
jgi:hypothetical protein